MLSLLPLLSVLLTGVPGTMSFSVGGNGCPINRLPFTTISSSSSSSLSMGLFDGIAKAFSNQDFQSQDQRVRASHILIKDNDDGDVDATLTKIKTLLAEIQSESSSPNNTSGEEDAPSLSQVFATIARRESACPSASKGGDLGWFGPKKMVPEFDEAIFGIFSTPAPPQGAIVGPVVTDFGCHIIYIAQRETDKTQMEEKLARIDPDAQ